MRCAKTTLFLIIFFALGCATSQWSTRVPDKINPENQYLFYLHGGVVQAQGIPAISEYYGQYEYLKIVKKLGEQGFKVISEVRPKDTKEAAYALKVSTQIDDLLAAGVPEKNITVVGASLGAYITMNLALMRRQSGLKYALLGLCSDYAVGLYNGKKEDLCGNFLSIYEASDSKGSCQSLFDTAPSGCTLQFKELKLEMGNDHAFLFQPFDEWVEPLTEWIKSDQ